jgi:hypothetical protein
VAVPDFQSVMLPRMQAISDGQDLIMRDLTGQLAECLSPFSSNKPSRVVRQVELSPSPRLSGAWGLRIDGVHVWI